MKKYIVIISVIIAVFAMNCLDINNKPIKPKNEPPKPTPATSYHDEFNHPKDLISINLDSNQCVSCHKGIDPIRATSSGMMQEIYKLAKTAGFPNNDCIVCHGGNPLANTKELAHAGTVDYFKENKGPKNYYPDPGAPTINEHTCGVCHEAQVRTQFTSLMYTEAGKIQGTTWGFGALQGYNHNVANTHVEEVVVHERLGTETYRKYMEQLKIAEPQVFPSEMMALPEAPTAEEVKERPELSVYTYLRQECQRCHTGVKGRFKNGDFRGIGCSACHIPYSNKGYYEGGDSMISHDKPGHMLVHSIQSTRDATVLVNGKTYSGIPVKTCQSCHNRGRRIGVSYEGLMETSYQSPFMGNADNQEKIHTKNYLHLQSDIHLKKGMLCQDCHTSGDAHSYGDLSGAIQGAVEIECTDCHGTPTQYPWELPIGYGDEVVGKAPRKGAARGVSDSLLPHQKYGTVYPSQDGYLLTARGNPYANVVRKGDKAVLHTASGKDIEFKPLKYLADNNELSQEAVVAKIQVHMHIEKMECYACHATWAPQCYGCHINIDYSKHGEKPDWVKLAGIVNEHGLTPDAVYGGFKNIDKRSDLSPKEIEQIKSFMIAGDVQEQRSFLRWENPPLVINGEKRVSPAIPGCQTTVTVKDADGKVQLLNHIFKVPHVEGAGEEGQLAIDMAPLQPHTIQKKSRSCESCHSDPKAMGFGINGGNLYARPDTNVVIDLVDGQGRPLANNVDTMFNSIPNLEMDWSRYLDEDGRQLQTVGHHFSGSRPLNKEELMRLDRRGVCMSCHKSIPEGDLAVNLMTHVGKYAAIQIDNKQHKSILNKSTRMAAWVQILGISFAILLPIGLFIRWWRKRNSIF